MGLTDVFSRLFNRQTSTTQGRNQSTTPVEHVIRWDATGKGGSAVTTSAATKKQDPFGDLLDDDEVLNIDDPHAQEPHSASSTTASSTSSTNTSAPAITEPKPASHNAGYNTQAPIDLGPAPRNKQELLNELRRNYAEVVNLVRKVDTHLDHQDRRSERMLEIAEKLPKAIEQIERLEDRHTELLAAVTTLTETLRQGHERHDTGVNRQIQALEQLHHTIGESNEQSRELSARVAGELTDFRGAVGQMVGSTQQLSTAIDTIGSRDDAREQQLRKTLEQTRKWTIGLVIFLGIAGLCAIAAVVIALLQK